MTRGKLIVIEGANGSGKSTQAKLLLDTLTARGIKCVASHEPYNRRLCKLSYYFSLCCMVPWRHNAIRAEMYAYMRDRETHVKKFIEPMLNAGTTVILDRYYLSTIAYQIAALNLKLGVYNDAPNTQWAYNFVSNGLPVPDNTIILKMPLQFAHTRIRARDGKPSPLKMSFRRMVHSAYDTIGQLIARRNTLVINCKRTNGKQQVADKILYFCGYDTPS